MTPAETGDSHGDGAGDGSESAADGGDLAGSSRGHECPFCGSTETERESAFGSEVSAEQHYCHGCHTVFERIKFDGRSASTGRGPE